MTEGEKHPPIRSSTVAMMLSSVFLLETLDGYDEENVLQAIGLIRSAAKRHHRSGRNEAKPEGGQPPAPEAQQERKSPESPEKSEEPCHTEVEHQVARNFMEYMDKTGPFVGIGDIADFIKEQVEKGLLVERPDGNAKAVSA